MDRPKLYLVSRNDSVRPSQVRAASDKEPVVRKLHPAQTRSAAGAASRDRPTAHFLPPRKAIWDDESSWDSI